MRKIILFCLIGLFGLSAFAQNDTITVIRINQLGYTPNGVKVAVWGTKLSTIPKTWQLVNVNTKRIATSGSVGKNFGAYGPFKNTFRINFTKFNQPGKYYLQSGGARSPEFQIGKDVYKGAADFALRYMRQQRTGFNPYLKDSCHTADGYVLYGKSAGIEDSTYFDVVGGWHDASDYLQYSTTSANATYQMLLAYRDFPQVFTDYHQANGLEGKNGLPDVLDEANWGLKWLLKMFPAPNIMFNQIADDRDHISMRMPAQDTQYGRANQRPVYFIDGNPQQRKNLLNATTGTSSTAAKFSGAFALAHAINNNFAPDFFQKSTEALAYANIKPGVTQTVSVKSPYIYAEENWVDDMELAYATQYAVTKDKRHLAEAIKYASLEQQTPWLGSDTAKHYQWYPFVNLGHYQLLKTLKEENHKGFEIIKGYYKKGIDNVWNKARQNAFYRGVPFIWCSNNLTVAFTQQCLWYRTQTGDSSYRELEQSNFDWLFGLNPWGTSMVYGLPAWGDTPIDPHSAFTNIKKYPIDGGLVDGPVYTSIYNGLIGITLYNKDTYAPFQSDLAVYHDDYGDYSTNEPTMDGTASLIYLLAAKEAESNGNFVNIQGAVTRGDSSKKEIALIFSAHEFADGATAITRTLQQQGVKASFFFTGDFLRTPKFRPSIQSLVKNGHYIGPHSDKHLLYVPWEKRSDLLVTKDSFLKDLDENYSALQQFGINKKNSSWFLPPYEWYNDSISKWAGEKNIRLLNFTPGTGSNADYTLPNEKNYRSTDAIFSSIIKYEQTKPGGLNGFLLLTHFGVAPQRKDKFYTKLPGLISYLKNQGYTFKRVDEMLN